MSSIHAVYVSAYNRNGLYVDGTTYFENLDDSEALVNLIETAASTGEWTLTKNHSESAICPDGVKAYAKEDAKVFLESCKEKNLNGIFAELDK